MTPLSRGEVRQIQEVQFNREVRMVEFDYYVKNLHNSRMGMLWLSYITLASFLALALCKLAFTFCLGRGIDGNAGLVFLVLLVSKCRL